VEFVVSRGRELGKDFVAFDRNFDKEVYLSNI
jgi:hypothetical protein